MQAAQNTNTIGPNPKRRQHPANQTLRIEICLARVTVLYVIWSLPSESPASTVRRCFWKLFNDCLMTWSEFLLTCSDFFV